MGQLQCWTISAVGLVNATDVARAATEISFCPPAAGGRLLHGTMSPAAEEDMTVTMILGFISELTRGYLEQKPVDRRRSGTPRIINTSN